MKFTIENSKKKVDLSNMKAELCLRESYDGTGVNLCVNISGHPDNSKNRRHYILRLLHNGKLRLFSDNFNIGLKVDDEGMIEFEGGDCL